MTPDNQSPATQLFEWKPSSGPASQGSRSNAPTFLNGVVKFCSIAVVTMMVSTAAIWLMNHKPSPNASADAFLWFAGQNKTWDEYQKGQKSAGRARLDEEELNWMQQLVNDAYSR